VRKKLSARQMQIFKFIASYVEANKYSPSLNDIANALNLKHSSAVGHLSAMRRKGVLDSQERIPRSFRLYPERVDFG
jgi:SOS-response transcriptional repressor LexA